MIKLQPNFVATLLEDSVMPIKHAAVKQMRKDRQRTDHNAGIKSELKTLKKRLTTLIQSQKPAEAKAILGELISKYDRAAKRHVLHANTAARNKSSLTRLVNRASPASS